MYAIIDIETTGGQFNEEGITEIAIHKFDGNDIIDSFISLINPEKEIQPFVVNLTGINNNMLRGAPKFFEVAKRIIEITSNCILVAHNTSFDYRILKTEFRRLGYNFEVPTLCTVELSKKLMPDLESYSLGRLCRNIGIPVTERHRANGDALATVKLLQLLLLKDVGKEIIKSSVKTGNSRDLSQKLLGILDDLPSKTGVFYFHDIKGEILFLGKGRNIRKMVNQIFLQTTKKSKSLLKELSSITFEITGSELISNLKYHEEAMLHKPKYNKLIIRSKSEKKFSNENMILIDRGRHISEKSVILIENNLYKGYGYTDLSYQVHNIEILRNIISEPKNIKNQNSIITSYLQKNQIEKYIRF